MIKFGCIRKNSQKCYLKERNSSQNYFDCTDFLLNLELKTNEFETLKSTTDNFTLGPSYDIKKIS